MKNKLFLISVISIVTTTFGGCTASFSTNGSNAAKPTTTVSSPAANKNTNTAAPAAKTDGAKTTVQNEKKPEGDGKSVKKDDSVPADWVYLYDAKKGYRFSVPAGTTKESDSSDGFDYTGLTTPSGIDIFALAYKDKTLTKEDLLKVAVSFLEGLGQKVTPGALKEEGDDYGIADATTVTEDGRKGKLRILVGTDVTDNYVLILGTDTDKFAANEKAIDEIWGSFEMWSGGANGKK